MFGNVHCLIGAGDQCFELFGIFIFLGDPDADRDTDLMTWNTDRFLGNTPAEFSKYIAAEVAKWTKVAKAAKLTAD